jgi:hypothetical protein
MQRLCSSCQLQHVHSLLSLSSISSVAYNLDTLIPGAWLILSLISYYLDQLIWLIMLSHLFSYVCPR